MLRPKLTYQGECKMKSRTHNELKNELSNYQNWKHCITELCGTPLTLSYIKERISELNDTNDPRTKKFIATWGETNQQQFISWFERAKQEINS